MINKTILVHGSLAVDLFYFYSGTISDHLLSNSENRYLNIRAAGPEKHFGEPASNIT